MPCFFFPFPNLQGCPCFHAQRLARVGAEWIAFTVQAADHAEFIIIIIIIALCLLFVDQLFNLLH